MVNLAAPLPSLVIGKAVTLTFVGDRFRLGFQAFLVLVGFLDQQQLVDESPVRRAWRP